MKLISGSLHSRTIIFHSTIMYACHDATPFESFMLDDANLSCNSMYVPVLVTTRWSWLAFKIIYEMHMYAYETSWMHYCAHTNQIYHQEDSEKNTEKLIHVNHMPYWVLTSIYLASMSENHINNRQSTNGSTGSKANW